LQRVQVVLLYGASRRHVPVVALVVKETLGRL
jgi:hypothetical protein